MLQKCEFKTLDTRSLYHCLPTNLFGNMILKFLMVELSFKTSINQLFLDIESIEGYIIEVTIKFNY